MMISALLMTRNVVPNCVRRRGVGTLVLLLLVPRPWYGVEGLGLGLGLLGLLGLPVLIALIREDPVHDWELVLVLHHGLAPGDSKPTVIDGDTLQLAQGHQRIAPQRELNKGIALEGPVKISDLAKVPEEELELVVGHVLLDAANAQGRIVHIGGVFAEPIRWRLWRVASRVGLDRGAKGTMGIRAAFWVIAVIAVKLVQPGSMIDNGNGPAVWENRFPLSIAAEGDPLRVPGTLGVSRQVREPQWLRWL
jgi:hypothetical protein